MLLRIIAAAQRECMTLANEPEPPKPMPKGVAKAVWAHAKGQREGMREGKGEAARRVLGKLKG